MATEAKAGNSPGKRMPLIEGVALAIGSVGLVVATATDSLAVIGRHTGFPLLGSIEVVQAAIVLLAASAMVLATIHGQHAAVHILTERLPPAIRARLARVANLLSALLFAILTAGTVWLIHDLWNGHERSELLHLPFRPLRLFYALSLVVVMLGFLRAAVSRAPGHGTK